MSLFKTQTRAFSGFRTRTLATTVGLETTTNAFKPLGPIFRENLLASVGLSGRNSENSALGHRELYAIVRVLNGTNNRDLKKSQDFLQVLAEYGLLAYDTDVSFGTSVQLDIARLFVERAAFMVEPGAALNEGEGRYLQGPKGCGKSTVLKAMVRAIPALVPTIKTVYIDATSNLNVRGSMPSGRLPCLGSEIWAALRVDHSTIDALDEDRVLALDALLAAGEPISLESHVMPALQAKGFKLIVAVDSLEKYFASKDSGVSWQADLEFFGNLNLSPCICILAGSSGKLTHLLQAAPHLLPLYPKLESDLNVSKIRQHRLPVADPFDLCVAQRALEHPKALAARQLPRTYAAALLMIGAGSNPRLLL